MSGQNTKDSKINRVLNRQIELNKYLDNIFALLRLNHETDQAAITSLSNSLKLSTEVNHRLEAENGRLRKYLGSVLFERRKREMQIPTLQPHVHRGSASLPIPHTSTETV